MNVKVNYAIIKDKLALLFILRSHTPNACDVEFLGILHSRALCFMQTAVL